MHPDQPPQPPLPTPHAAIPLSAIASQPLNWLWPQRIPLGKLTLLDAAPGCGASLFALTLGACVSAGLPFPDGHPSIAGPVILIAPHDSLSDTIKPRLQAAGGNSDHVLPLTNVADSSLNTPHQSRPFSLPHDLDLLETIIVHTGALLVIIDPFSAIPGLLPSLLALAHLAARTNCAIVLTRSLSHSPADPLRPRCPVSPVLTAARSHLLLAPDPANARTHLLLTPKHPLCSPPAMLSYQITATGQGIPTIHWLGERDSLSLRRLCTGPMRSPHRQAILRFLQDRSTPCSIKDILTATSYDYEPGRKMLVRMLMAGELVSPARGLYTTPDHPCLAQFPAGSQPESPASTLSPIPNVPCPNVPVTNIPSPNGHFSHHSPALAIPTSPPSETSLPQTPTERDVPTLPPKTYP